MTLLAATLLAGAAVAAAMVLSSWGTAAKIDEVARTSAEVNTAARSGTGPQLRSAG